MAAGELSPVPKHFSAYVGGFLGPSFQAEVHDGILIYTRFGPGHSKPVHTTIKPTARQWREFRQTLDELKVWQWHPEYLPSGPVMDGTQWSLDIAYRDHALKVHGDNSYPDAAGKPNGKPEPTKSFNRYLNAIEGLSGGRTFE